MVLVDTSVWIRFLANRSTAAATLEELLRREEVLGHELVFGELLIGERGRRTRLLDEYLKIEHAPVVPHSEVVIFVKTRNLHGRGIGWIDAQLLASALVCREPLWTVDATLAALARDLGVDYALA